MSEPHSIREVAELLDLPEDVIAKFMAISEIIGTAMAKASPEALEQMSELMAHGWNLTNDLKSKREAN